MDKMSMIEKMRNLYDYIESAHNHIKLITEIIQDEKEQKRYSDKKSIFQGKISINSDLTKDMYIIKNTKNSHLKKILWKRLRDNVKTAQEQIEGILNETQADKKDV